MIKSALIVKISHLKLIFLLIIISTSCLFNSSFADSPKTANGLSIAQSSKASALFHSKVKEIQQLNTALKPFGVQIAFYGGTSREIINEIIEGISESESYDVYIQKLKMTETISYLNWHRLGSDLDLYVVGDDNQQTRDVVREFVLKAFPPSHFYKSVDVLWPREFFNKFPPGNEHFEATSNLIISENGFLFPKDLDVQVNGRYLNLGRWGVEQFLNGEFQFERNLKITKSPVVYRDFRQILRWIRYVSEFPWVKLSAHSKSEIVKLINLLISHSYDELLALLNQGNTLQEKPTSDGERLIEALEKLQLYSGNSELTHRILEELGLIKIFKDAGIADQRVLKPLRPRTDEEIQKAVNMTPIGISITLRHRTHLTAAQSMSRGALWMSDNNTIIKGKQTASALTAEGIYAAPEFESLSYGDYSLKLYLSPNAIEGIDFVKSGRYYVILTREAIIHPGKNEFSLEKLTAESLIENCLQILDSKNTSSLNSNQRESTFRVLMSLIQPWRSVRESQLFNQIMKLTISDRESFLIHHIVFSNTMFISDFLNGSTSQELSNLFLLHFSSLSNDKTYGWEYKEFLIALATSIAHRSLDTIPNEIAYWIQKIQNRSLREMFISKILSTRNVYLEYRDGSVNENTRIWFNNFLIRGINGRENSLPTSFFKFKESLSGFEFERLWVEIEPFLPKIAHPIQRARFFLTSIGHENIKHLLSVKLPKKMDQWIAKHIDELIYVLSNDEYFINLGESFNILFELSKTKPNSTPSKWLNEIIIKTISSGWQKLHPDDLKKIFDNPYINSTLFKYHFTLWNQITLSMSLWLDEYSLDPRNKSHWRLLKELTLNSPTIEEIKSIAVVLSSESFRSHRRQINEQMLNVTYVNFLIYQEMREGFDFSQEVQDIYESLQINLNQAIENSVPLSDWTGRRFKNPLPIINFYSERFGITQLRDLVDWSVYERMHVYFNYGVNNFSKEQKKENEKWIINWIISECIYGISSPSSSFSLILRDTDLLNALIELLSKNENLLQLASADQSKIYRNVEFDSLKTEIENYVRLVGLVFRMQSNISVGLIEKLNRLAIRFTPAGQLLKPEGYVQFGQYWFQHVKELLGLSKQSDKTTMQDQNNYAQIPEDAWTQSIYDIFATFWSQFQPSPKTDSEGNILDWSNRFKGIHFEIIRSAKHFPDKWIKQAVKDLTTGSTEEILRTLLILSEVRKPEVFLRLKRPLDLAFQRLTGEDKVFALEIFVRSQRSLLYSQHTQGLLLTIINDQWANLQNSRWTTSYRYFAAEELSPVQWISYLLISEWNILISSAPHELVYRVLIESQSSPALLETLAYKFRDNRNYYSTEAQRLLQYMRKLENWPLSSKFEDAVRELLEEINSQSKGLETIQFDHNRKCIKKITGSN